MTSLKSFQSEIEQFSNKQRHPGPQPSSPTSPTKPTEKEKDTEPETEDEVAEESSHQGTSLQVSAVKCPRCVTSTYVPKP